jgi:hypothetical protein
MPPVVEEKFGSPRLGTDSAESYWIITGTDDEFGAKTALLYELPTSLDGIPLQNAHIEQIAPLIWEGTGIYGVQQQQTPPQTGDSSFSFDTSGGSQHITQALQNIANYAPSGSTAPNYQGAVGVTHDSVEGVDITPMVMPVRLGLAAKRNVISHGSLAPVPRRSPVSAAGVRLPGRALRRSRDQHRRASRSALRASYRANSSWRSTQ